MKQITGLICLVSFCAGAVWVEYQMASRLGAAFVLAAGTCALAAIRVALYRAPEAQEGADGFHILPRSRRSRLGRYVRLFRRQVRQEWT
jgi:hypothetical protein